jgi:hypothetical protein
MVARKLTKWNRGTYEPEFRIPMMLFAALFCGIGWFVFTWDLDNPTPNGYYLGAFCHGCLCCGTTIGITFANLYILLVYVFLLRMGFFVQFFPRNTTLLITVGSDSDAFRENSTEIFILLMTGKNFIFYGFSQVINTWSVEKGPSDVLRTFGIITMCLIGTSPLLCKFDQAHSTSHKQLIER